MIKFYTLSLRAGSAGSFNSRLEATVAITALIEQGYHLDSSDIEEYGDDSETYMTQGEGRQDC